MIEHMLMAGFVIWLIASALYILDTIVSIVNKLD